jgi:YD repeat-containing protein
VYRYKEKETTSTNTRKSTVSYEDKNERRFISSWHLSEIVYPNMPSGHRVLFTYVTQNTTEYSDSYLQRYFYRKSDAIICGPYEFAALDNVKKFISRQRITEKYISQIRTEDNAVNVNFNYANDRMDRAIGRRLTGLSVMNHLNQTVVNWTLEQSYFDAWDSFYQNGKRGYTPYIYSRRLKLKALRMNGQLIRSFDYTNDKHFYEGSGNADIYELPPRDSYYFDHWGYYNGGPHLGPTYKAVPEITDFCVRTNTCFSAEGISRSPEQTHAVAQANLLWEIKYPTGSYTRITYGTNPNNGGVRVEKTEDFDENDEPVSGALYEYFEENAMPLIRYYEEAPKDDTGCYEYWDVHSYATTLFYDLNGPTGGYRRVRVTDINTGASTETEYMDVTDRQIHAAFKYIFKHTHTAHENDDLVVKPQSGPPYVTNDLNYFDRGIPKKTTTKDSEGDVRNIETMTYTVANSMYSIQNVHVKFKTFDDNDKQTDYYVATYNIVSRPVHLTSSTSEVFDNNVWLVSSQSIEYHSTYPTLPKKTIQIGPDGTQSASFTRYPSDISAASTTFTGKMVAKNMVAVPIENYTKVKFSGEPNYKFMGSSLNTMQVYNEGTSNEFIAPYQSYSLVLDKPIEETGGIGYMPVTIHGSGELVKHNEFVSSGVSEFNAQGRLISQTGREGITKTYTYNSYGYVTQTTTTAADGISRSSTYQYFPLIGIKSVTDANGDKISYEYDHLNRLHLVRDKDNNIVKRYRYHSISDDLSFSTNVGIQGYAMAGNTLTFTSKNSASFYGATTYSWDFGDGTSPVQTTNENVTHTYQQASPANAPYQVKLTITNPEYAEAKLVSRNVSISQFAYNAVPIVVQDVNMCDSNSGLGAYMGFLETSGAYCLDSNDTAYQWERNIGGTWVIIYGATNPWLVMENAGHWTTGTHEIRCVISSQACPEMNMTTNPATVTIICDGSGGGPGGMQID